MTAVYIVVPLLSVVAIVALVAVGTARRKRTEDLLGGLRELALQIGAVEHSGHGSSRPSFGHFPGEADGSNPAAFEYAFEFQRSGFHVVASERKVRKHSPGGTSMPLSYEAHVQVRTAPCPRLWVGPELLAVQNLDLRAQIVPELSVGRHHRRLCVASADPEFARSVVTPELFPWLTDRLGAWFHPIVLEHGTLRTKPRPGERLTAENLLPTADLLIEFLRLLPPRFRIEASS